MHRPVSVQQQRRDRCMALARCVSENSPVSMYDSRLFTNSITATEREKRACLDSRHELFFKTQTISTCPRGLQRLSQDLGARGARN